MPIPLLVVTTDLPFGESLRQSLEKTGRFGVRVTGEQEAAVTYVQKAKCPLAFLDAATEEAAMIRIGRNLRVINPEIRFVVISEVGWHSALEKIFPLYYLSKPFQVSDLLEMMDKFFPASQSGAAAFGSQPQAETGVAWLSDVTRAAQNLARMTMQSAAQAALITHAGRLWAYSGQLPQSATDELAATVTRYWDLKAENDLVRFVRLDSTSAEHMLYATRLAEGMVLALVFDAETPFSTIRTQATQLVHSLASAPTEESEESEESTREEEPADEIPLTSLSDILQDVPSPNPSGDISLAPANLSFEIDQASPRLASPDFSTETRPVDQMDAAGQDELDDGLPEQTDQAQAPTRRSRSQKIRELTTEELEETRPHVGPVGATKIVLEPVSPSVYNLSYACLLIPRFANHYLTGDLAYRVSEWVQQICVAFGWRLEYISVRPEYVQWIVNVPPATSPGYLMRLMRQHVSEKIFNHFSQFKKDNPSGDFWAPGYLIMGGTQPAPAQLIKDFIVQTRQRQGIIPPAR